MSESADARPPSPGSSPPASEPGQTARAFWPRLLARVLLVTTLLFGGLFARQLRLTFEQMQLAAAAVQRAGAVEAQYKEREAVLTQAEQQVKQAMSLLALATDPGIHRFSLQGSPARGQVFHQPERGRLGVFVFDLPTPEADKGYQVWARTADEAVRSLGMLPVEANGLRALLVAAPAEPLESVQVTLEPSTGSKAPAGTIVLEGPSGAPAAASDVRR